MCARCSTTCSGPPAIWYRETPASTHLPDRLRLSRCPAREATRIIPCSCSPFVRLWKTAAVVLLAWGNVLAQPEPQPQDLEQQLIEAVREGNQMALLDLIKKPAGRQQFLALSDSLVFEIMAARMLSASLPQSPDDR